MNNPLAIFKLLFSILMLVFTSWILVHILALFGVFLAVAYPVWWLFAPKQTACLLCRAEKEGAMCPFCNKQVVKSKEISPQHFKSAVLNGVLILIFSTVSLGLVCAESQTLTRLGFPPTPKTASFIIPSKGQYRIGEIFQMKLDIDNMQNAINAVQADINFEPEKLEVIEFSTRESFANIFIQKEINNEIGYARLTGGLPNPGYSGKNGTFGIIFFKARTPGLTKVRFLPSSLVLANDGKGTNILKNLPSASYLILPETITEDEEKAQEDLTFFNLEANSESGDLFFFDDEVVTGVRSENQTITNERSSLFDFILNSLASIDRFVLDFWQKVLIEPFSKIT
jgi:hypothetical protein